MDMSKNADENAEDRNLNYLRTVSGKPSLADLQTSSIGLYDSQFASSHQGRGRIMRVWTFKNWGRVVHHQNGVWTDVELTEECLPFNVSLCQVPTECIPLEFRPIGSRFFFQRDGFIPEDPDTANDLKERVLKSCRILHGSPLP